MAYNNISDESLALLEQITYIDSNVLKAAGIKDKDGDDLKILPLNEKASIDDILKVFDDEAIANLRKIGDDAIDGALISGNEWADIIENLKNNKELENLEVFYSELDPSKSVNLNVCYKDRETGQGVITYKGTTGYEEWEDNCLGLTQATTDDQKAALEFYDCCIEKANAGELDNIILTGHSKGGNKAMYVTVVADDPRITKCVSFDGQGFSNEFYEDYFELAEKNGGKITNYFVNKDFVHALMKQISHSQQISCEGYGMDNAPQYHSPNSFFVTDEDGNIQSTDGIPEFADADEVENIKLLNKFVVFAMNHYSEEELEAVGQYLGKITGSYIGDSSLMDGTGALFSDEEAFLTLGSVFYNFAKKYDLSREDFDDFMQTFAVGDEQAEVVDNLCEYVHNMQDSIIGLDNAVTSMQEDGISGIPDAIDGLGAYVGNAADIAFDFIGDAADYGLSASGNILEGAGNYIGGPFENIGAGANDLLHLGGNIINEEFDLQGDYFNGSVEENDLWHNGAISGAVSGALSDIVDGFVAGALLGPIDAGLSEPIVNAKANEDKSFSYTPIENPSDYYKNQHGKRFIKQEEDKQMNCNRRAIAH